MNVYVDYRTHLSGLPRGEAADFFPTYPTPFTGSLFREGWNQARRLLSMRLNADLPSPWAWDKGQFHVVPAFWSAAIQALDLPGHTVTHLLALPGFPREKSHRPRRGLLSLFARSRKRSTDAYQEDIERLDHEIGRWYRQVQRMSWVQAEILQVMEEVAVYVGKALYGYTLATLALLEAIAHTPDPSQWIQEVYTSAHALPSIQPILPQQEGKSLQTLAHEVPWLGFQPFETAVPRWAEDTSMLDKIPTLSPEQRSTTGVPSPWLAARERMRVHLARVITATRRWIHAAAQEALEDGRIQKVDDIFLLELEEVKQMMTGEWSDPQHVHRIIGKRHRTYEGEKPIPRHAKGWLQDITAFPEDSTVAAPGWHPGWWVQAAQARQLGTAVTSPLSYGHLLAAALNKPIRVVNTALQEGE